MKKTILRTRSSIVRGSIMVVLLFTLFTMMSLTAFASNQHMQGSRSTLVPFPAKAPSGNAQLQWNSHTKALTVTVHVSGLQPRSNHAAHIHAGPCSKEGRILYPFKNIVADAAGNGSSMTIFKNVTGGIPASGWDITVHNGSTAQTGALLCGNVANPRRASSVSIPLSTMMH
jgi:hypothetical protein